MVELEGARTLVPACSRLAEDGMVIHTDSDRVRLNRKMVLELLASSVDLSTTPILKVYLERYEAAPERYGPPAAPDPDREHHRPGHHIVPDGQTAATVAGPPKIDNELYMRDYSKCVPLLQVRRRVRRPAPEHVRDHGRRPRVRRARLDRVLDAAAGVGVRLLR